MPEKATKQIVVEAALALAVLILFGGGATLHATGRDHESRLNRIEVRLEEREAALQRTMQSIDRRLEAIEAKMERLGSGGRLP